MILARYAENICKYKNKYNISRSNIAKAFEYAKKQYIWILAADYDWTYWNEVEDAISGSGKQAREVLCVDDMIRLYINAPKYIETAKGQVFNIGGCISNSLSLLELFSILEEELSIKMKYTKLPPRESDQKIFVVNILKTKDI